MLINNMSSPDEIDSITEETDNIIKRANDSTTKAEEVKDEFEAVIKKVNELSEGCMAARGKVEEQAKRAVAQTKAEEYLEDEKKKRLEKYNNHFQGNQDKVNNHLTELESANEDDIEALDAKFLDSFHIDEYSLEINLNRELLVALCDEILELFLPDGQSDQNKVQGPKGALYVMSVLERIRSGFISIRSTSINSLFLEAIEITRTLASNSFTDPEYRKHAERLRAKAQEWKPDLDINNNNKDKKEGIPASVKQQPEQSAKPEQDLNVVRGILMESFKILIEFRDSWIQLTEFFRNLALILQTTLTQSIQSFSSKSKLVQKMIGSGKAVSDAVKNPLLVQTFHICRIAMQVAVISGSYQEVHKSYLATSLSGLGNLLKSDPNDRVPIQQLVAKIEKDCEAAGPGIEKLTRDKAQSIKQTFAEFLGIAA